MTRRRASPSSAAAGRAAPPRSRSPTPACRSRCSSGADARRARAARRRATASPLDNGQHLLLGAYRADAGARRRACTAPSDAARLFQRLPLTLRPFGAPRRDAFELTAWSAPAPLHLAGGVLAARGLVVARARRRSSPGSGGSQRAGFRVSARTKRWPQCFAATPRRAFAAGLGAALPRGAQHAAGARVGAGLRATCCEPRSAARRATATSSSPPSICPRASPTPPRGSSPRAAAIVRCGVAVRGDRAAPATRSTLDVGAERRDVRRGDRRRRSASARRDARRRRGRGGAPWRAPLAQVAAFAYESITTIYLGFAAPRSVRRADAPARRRAGPMGVRPQRARSGERCAAGHARAWSRSSSARAGRTMRSTTRRSRATSTRSCGACAPDLPAVTLVAGDRRAARDVRVHAGARAPGGRARRARRLSRRRLRRPRISGDARSRDAERRRAPPMRAHRRLRSSRCCSRFHSRSLIVARLSYCFLPLASPRSSLIRPLAVVQVERHQRVAGALDLADEAVDLAAVQQELAGARRIGRHVRRRRDERRDVRADEDDLAVLDDDVGFLDLRAPGADRLHLPAVERDARLRISPR